MCEEVSAPSRRRWLLSGSACGEAVDVTAIMKMESPSATQIAALRAALHTLLVGGSGSGSGSGSGGGGGGGGGGSGSPYLVLGACIAAAWSPAGTGWLTSETVLVYDSEDVAPVTVSSCENEWAKSITGSLMAALSGYGSVREGGEGGG
jgi:hypothetical protein